MARSVIRSLNDRKLSVRNLIPTWPYVVERVTRIELALSAWEADVLPLNYTRVTAGRVPSCRMSRAPALSDTTCYRNR
jgi:hypothetical protein